MGGRGRSVHEQNKNTRRVGCQELREHWRGRSG
jgi:hypothetical protein